MKKATIPLTPLPVNGYTQTLGGIAMIRELREFSKKHDLDSVGLIMEDELIEEWYDSTPLNCLTFASTGGDGVHFSIIKDFGVQSPVVMTVPMNFDEENLVIANSLYEFLCLGSHFGFFELERLLYNFEATVEEIEQSNQSSHSNKVLSDLSKVFNLKTISNVANYIADVNKQYSARLLLGSA